MIYLVSFTPMEPYSFGTDQNFSYPGGGKTGKESYFVRSVFVPEQTTILGTLRYMALMRANKLKTDFSYSDAEKQEIAEWIGKESFGFFKKDQSFGRIHSVSPLFLIDAGKESVLVRNPYHNVSEKTGYTPIRLSDKAMNTSEGIIHLPENGQYDAKAGHADGYISLQTKELHRDLFQSRFISGNAKKAEGESDEKRFFRREVVRLNKGYSFAVLVDAEEDTLPKECFVHMGQKKSAFRAVVQNGTEVPGKIAELLLTDKSASPSEMLKAAVEKTFDTGETWYYALSDLMLSEASALQDFAIVEMKHLRNLETVMDAQKALNKLRRSEVRFNLISAGSVFYGNAPSMAKSESLCKAGYNVICKLGGESQ